MILPKNLGSPPSETGRGNFSSVWSVNKSGKLHCLLRPQIFAPSELESDKGPNTTINQCIHQEWPPVYASDLCPDCVRLQPSSQRLNQSHTTMQWL